MLVALLTALKVPKELALREWWRIRRREEATDECAEAKWTIAQLIQTPKGGWLKCPNRYKYVWAKWKGLTTEEDWQRLNKAQRRLSHFWVDVVELVTRRILILDEVWRAVGDPEFIFVLEPLEVFKAAREIRNVGFGELKPWPWEAAKALGWWLEKKDKKAAKAWKRGRIPVEPDKLQELDCD